MPELPVQAQDEGQDPGAGARFRGDRIVEVGPVWELRDRIWAGELFGFTEFLRPAEDPTQTRCVSLDVRNLPPSVVSAVLRAMGLGIGPDARRAEVIAAIGEPREQTAWGDRVELGFSVAAGEDGYEVAAVFDRVGLVYLTVTLVE